MKSVKPLEEYGLLTKRIIETIENEEKEEKTGFISTSLSALVPSLLTNLLAGKGLIRAGEDAIRAGQGL